MIKTGTSLRRVVYYNEQKVTAGVAECLLAANYPKAAAELSLAQKLRLLQRQTALNERVTRPSVHISLNFAPGEELSPDVLCALAQDYMQRIGFGEQPYLVYRHRDAGHPHLHLVSTKVRADGSRIDMHNIGRQASEKARQALEQTYGLRRAQERRHALDLPSQAVPARIVHYGRTETKQAMQAVLDAVLPHYRYTSLPELNAVLGDYRLAAERGSANSRVYRHRGLLYRIVDEQGRGVGVPLKASAFRGNYTLSYLEQRFALNQALREPHRLRLRQRLDLALLRPPGSLAALKRVLEQEGIQLVLRQNAAGLVYGLTYVDHHTRCVFNGSTLGKGYSAKAVLERCTTQPGSDLLAARLTQRVAPGPTLPDTLHGFWPGTGRALGEVLQPTEAFDYVPRQLTQRRKRKKRGQSNT